MANISKPKPIHYQTKNIERTFVEQK